MKYYVDCEFDGHNGPLLSVALVREDDKSIHIRVDIEPMDLWVRKNVWPLMDQHQADYSRKVYLNDVGGSICWFIGADKNPVVIADSLQDSRYFSQALTTDSGGGYASCPFKSIKFEIHNLDCSQTNLEGAVQHNAWWDAMALKKALEATQ